MFPLALSTPVACSSIVGETRPDECASTSAYAELVTISGGVRLYGGFACPGSDAGASWSYIGSKTVVAPSSGMALKLSGVSAAVIVEDFEFDAADATTPGESSVAA